MALDATRFCSVCRNYLYPAEQEGTLVHKCAFCATQVPLSKDALVYEVVRAKSAKTDSTFNPYLTFDPTLPRLTHLPCPSRDCPSNQPKGPMREVIYQVLDEDALRYAYVCVHCKSRWNN